MANAKQTFGSCCDSLKEAMAGGEGDEEAAFEPLISVGDEGVLFMAVGLAGMDDGEPGTIEHPIFFCPFCGTKLQTPDEIDAKLAGGAPN